MFLFVRSGLSKYAQCVLRLVGVCVAKGEVRSLISDMCAVVMQISLIYSVKSTTTFRMSCQG
jgi:hypothetical protein